MGREASAALVVVLWVLGAVGLMDSGDDIDHHQIHHFPSEHHMRVALGDGAPNVEDSSCGWY